jgi:hypothetical protein
MKNLITNANLFSFDWAAADRLAFLNCIPNRYVTRRSDTSHRGSTREASGYRMYRLAIAVLLQHKLWVVAKAVLCGSGSINTCIDAGVLAHQWNNKFQLFTSATRC